MPSAIFIDSGVLQRMIEKAIEDGVQGSVANVIHLGEAPANDPDTVDVRVTGFEVKRRHRRSPDAEPDMADVQVTVDVSCPEAQQEASVLAIGSAITLVSLALDHATLRDAGTTHILTLDAAGETVVSDLRDLHQQVGARIVVTGVAERTSGNSREERLS